MILSKADLEKLKSYRDRADRTMGYAGSTNYAGEATGRIYGVIDTEAIKRAMPVGLNGTARFVEGFRLCMEASPAEVREGEIIVGDYYCMLPYEVIPMLRAYGRKGMQIMQSCGHTVGNITRAMGLGWDGISAEISASREAHLAAGHADRAAYLDDLLRVVDIIIARIERYAVAAQTKLDADPGGHYAGRYAQVTAMCRKLAHQPPDTLHEALQWHWLYITFERVTSSGMGACKLDAVFLPYYVRDIARGLITPDDAVQLLQAAFLKEILFYSIGGMNPDGSDATNALSFAALRAYDGIGGPGNLNVRWHPGIDPDFFALTLDVIDRHRTGTPGIVNDAVIMRSLEKYGFTRPEAASYCFAGCFWYVVPGKEYPYHDMESISGPRVLAAAIAEASEAGRAGDAGGGDFAAFMSIFEAKTEDGLASGMEALADIDAQAPEAYPEMVLSLITDGCIAAGRDITDNGAEKSMTTILYVGLATVADSLYALKKAVFEERRFTLAEFAALLREDFAGGEDARLMLTLLPKFGNDDTEADELCVRVAQHFKRVCARLKNSKGFAVRPAFYSWHRHIFEGNAAGATPDGRRAGTPVAQGVNPAHGRATAGLTAAVNSIAKIGFDDTAGAPMHVHFSAVRNPGDAEALRSLVVTAFAKGLPHLIINHIDRATLREAMEHPEEHRDLVIRVTGYSARFVTLSPEVQEEVLKRTVY